MRTLLAICFCLTFIVGYGQDRSTTSLNKSGTATAPQSGFSIDQNQIDPAEINSVNEPPVISGSETVLRYLPGSGAVEIDTRISITDVDDTHLTAGRMLISYNYKISEDLIDAAEQFGITVTYDASTATLYFKGVATIEEYEIILSSATYSNSNPDPEPSFRDVAFKVFDEHARSNYHTRKIEILPVISPRIVDVDDMPVDTLYFETEEDVPLDICLNVLNENNLDLSFSLINPAGENTANGTLVGTDDGDLCLLYTPEKDFHGESIWDLEICSDSLPDLCDDVVVVINVLSVNDAPVAVNDTVSAVKNNMIEGIVTENDYDIDGDNLILTESPVVNPVHGTVVFYSDGSFEYNPDKGYYGEDNFMYEVCDDGEPSLCDTAEVFVTVEDVPLKVYNAVSPNGDDLNDYLFIEGIEYYPDNWLSIYDRYNNLVYETLGYNNENNNWQGQVNKGISTRDLPGDTYFYILNPGDGTPLLKGFIMLKKN